MNSNQTVLSAAERQGAVDAQLTNHQKAVNVLVELALFACNPRLRDCLPDVELCVPYGQIPALFRRAVKEHAAHGEERSREESAILKHALTLLEQGGDETTQTLEQEEFYSSLAFWKDDSGLHVKYEPQNVTVN
jgi:hypothetical protein